MQQVRLGFRPEAVVAASFVLPQQRYGTDDRQISFFNELQRRLQAAPQFASSAITDSVPPGGDPRSKPFVALIGGGNSEDKGLAGLVKWRYVSPGYFETLGIAVVRGRAFSKEDVAEGRKAIIVNQSLARRLFGDEDPIGKPLRSEGLSAIVGVAADVRNAGVTGATDPEFYVVRGLRPNDTWSNQRPPFGWRQATAVVRSSLKTGAALDSLRMVIAEMDPSIVVLTSTLDVQMRQYFARPRFQTALLSLFAGIGLVLAAVGLYGLTSFMVAERTREIGVRMALGSTPGGIVRMMMSEGVTWTALGMASGLVMSVAAMSWMRALLFEADGLDARVFGAASALLVLVALLATFFPSRRAARISPMAALRQ